MDKVKLMQRQKRSEYTVIPAEEVRFEPTSGRDIVGDVFHWHKGIYRGIRDPYAEFYSSILSSDLGEKLTTIGLVPTKVTRYMLEGYELVLEHQKIPVVSYASEWCTAMFKDAAILTCNLHEELLTAGLTLKDAHPQNVLFDCARPTFVDIGSIAKSAGRGKAFFLNDFRRTFLYPLLLRQSGLALLANAALVVHLGAQSFVSGNPDSPTSSTLYRACRSNMPARQWMFHRFEEYRINRMWLRDPVSALRRLRDQVKAIPEDCGVTRGQPADGGAHATARAADPQHRELGKILEQCKPESVIILGVGDGQSTLLAENCGARVLAADIDDARLNRLYRYVAARNLRILPVRMDLHVPNQKHGPWGVCSAAESRLRSDLVIIEAMTSHFFTKERISFDQLSRRLAAFSSRSAIVQFDERRWEGTDSWEATHCTEFSLGRFQEHLRRHFSEVRVAYEPREHRTFLVCSR